MMKSLILLFLTVFFAICIKAASPSYNNFDTNSFLISGVTNGIPYVAVPIISVKNGGSGGATYSFYNTNLPAGFLVTNAATVGIGTNAPSGSTTNVVADNIDNSTGHAYMATNPANQFTGTFNGNATTATTNYVNTATNLAVQSANQYANSLSGHPYVTGLIEWNDPAQIYLSTNNQPLASFPDTSGNGNSLLNATTNQVLFSSGGINGHPAINFPADWNLATGATPVHGYALTNGVWASSMTNNSTITWVWRDMLEKGGAFDNSPTLDGGQPLELIQFGTNYSFGFNPHDAEAAYTAGFFVLQNTTTTTTPLVALQYHHTANVFTMVWNNGVGTLWVNGIPTLQNISYFNYLPIGNHLTVGSFWNQPTTNIFLPDCVNGYIGDIVVSSTNETPGEISTLQLYEMKKYSIETSFHIVSMGDSITVGEYANVDSNFTCIVHDYFPMVEYDCMAVPGNTSSQQTVSMTNWIDYMPPNSIITCQWGADDMHTSVAITVPETNYINAAALAHSHGKKFVACTMPSLSWENSYSFDRSTFNAWIVANSNLFDGVVRYDLDPNMGPDGSYTNYPQYYHSDDVHLTGNSYNLLTQRWLAPMIQQIEWQIANAPSGSTTNVVADNIDNSTGHAYMATNPANQFTGTFNGNATTATNGYASTNRVYWQAHTQTNVFWGDSLTAGNQDGLGDSYPLFLTLYSGVQNLNFGIGGAGSDTILTNFTSTFHTNLWSQPTFIWSGNNDVGNGAAAVETNLLTMALDLKSVGNTNYWFLTLIYNTNGTPATETNLLACNAWLQSTFTNHVIDVRSWVNGHPDPTSLVDSNAVYQGFAPASLRYDLIHFNSFGYSLVADFVNMATMPAPTNIVTEARLRDVLATPPVLGVGIPLTAGNLNISNNVQMGTAPLYFGANTYLQQAFDGSLQIISGEPSIYMHGINLGAPGSAVGGITMTGVLNTSGQSILMGDSTHGFDIAGDGNLQIQSGTGGTVYASGLYLGGTGGGLLNAVYSKQYFIGTNGSITISGDGNISINTMTASGIIYVNGKDIGASGYRGGTAYFTNFNDNYGLLPASTTINTNNATTLSSGTVADARLSANVPLLNGNQTFSGVNKFTNYAVIGYSTPSQTNLVINGANPFAIGNGEWWTTPIPFLRPTTSGQGIAFDIMPNGAGAQQDAWIDICSSDFFTNSSSPTSGEKLNLKKSANGDSHISDSSISATYRALDMQDESSTTNLAMNFGYNKDIDFLQGFSAAGDMPAGSFIVTASQSLSIIPAGNTKGLFLGYVDSGGNKSAVEITNNATGANDGTLKLMKGGGFITSGAGTNTFSGAVILSSPSSATSAYTLGLTAGGVVTETGSGLSTLLSTNTTPTLFLGRDSNSNLTVTAAGATFTGVDIPTNTSGTHGYTGYFTNGIFVSSGTY